MNKMFVHVGTVFGSHQNKCIPESNWKCFGLYLTYFFSAWTHVLLVAFCEFWCWKMMCFGCAHRKHDQGLIFCTLQNKYTAESDRKYLDVYSNCFLLGWRCFFIRCWTQNVLQKTCIKLVGKINISKVGMSQQLHFKKIAKLTFLKKCLFGL